MFDWPLHMTEKAHLTPKDILDFNAAIAYAIIHFSLKIPYNVSWEKTLVEQSKLMNEKLPDELSDTFIVTGDI
ncbi:MAG: hypothetical protein EBZ77_10710 [Chitinophagia bacterium]|nr:hypothetical protein [Chitinophagia bacterium]